MSETFSANMLTHLAGEVTTLATCWKLTTQDSPQVTYGFTNHDEDIVYDGVTYQSSAGATPTSVATSSDMRVDELAVSGFLNSSTITEAKLLAGDFDYAEVQVFLINYNSTADGIALLRKGWLGEVRIDDTTFTAEIRGLAQHLQQAVGRNFKIACDADLGDSRCAVNLATFTDTGTVTGVTSNSVFADSSRTEADNYYRHGVLTWTSGNNVGKQVEVKDFTQSTGTFELYYAMVGTVQVGDTYSVYAGCDKQKSTCVSKFSNVVNFRGFAEIPGIDSQFKSP